MARFTEEDRASANLGMRWTRFVIGLCILAGMVSLFASGYTPPGVCGEVIRHNQQAGIDASPFFYGDVENILELIEGAEELADKAATAAF